MIRSTYGELSALNHEHNTKYSKLVVHSSLELRERIDNDTVHCFSNKIFEFNSPFAQACLNHVIDKMQGTKFVIELRREAVARARSKLGIPNVSNSR